MRALYLAPALLLSVLALTPATAAPVAPFAPLTAASLDQPVIQAQYHRDRHPGPRYRAGQRYRTAPNGWHRYDRRPSDWSRRRCGMVGPVWFCP
jgi:hypothetical protein